VGYCKIYTALLRGGVNDQPDHVFRLWVTMLLLADQDGVVRGSVRWLSKEANNMPLDHVRGALEFFNTPDAESKCQEYEGRRAVPVEGGWLIVTKKVYREAKRDEDLREYQAQWARDDRARKKATPIDAESTKVDTSMKIDHSDSESNSIPEAKASGSTDPNPAEPAGGETPHDKESAARRKKSDRKSPDRKDGASLSPPAKRLVDYIDRFAREHCPDLDPLYPMTGEDCVIANSFVKARDAPNLRRIRFAIYWAHCDVAFWRGQIRGIRSLVAKDNLGQILSKSAPSWNECKDDPEAWSDDV
jgi:hypothetical protein